MKKLTNKKGFTLMEMLIVIAIIVILVAIAVPSFSASLEKANKATDAANFRAAEAAGMIKAMEANSDGTYYYDLDKGDVVKTDDANADTAGSVGSCDTHDEEYIKVVITNGKAEVTWSTSGKKGCE